MAGSKNDFSTIAAQVTELATGSKMAIGGMSGKVLYPRRERNVLHQMPVTGGTPITEETAIALRKLVFGQCPGTIRLDFFGNGPGLVFREPERDLSYGLAVGNFATMPVIKSMLMAIQAHVLRTLLFEKRPNRTAQSPLKPGKAAQQEALCTALTDILWKAAGDSHQATLCLPQSQSYVSESETYNVDGVTEKLHLLVAQTYDDLFILVRRYLYLFQTDPGPALILLLYSAILSRTIPRIYDDLGKSNLPASLRHTFNAPMINLNGDISFCVLTLMLTGRATPYLHNSIIYVGDENNFAVAQVGITSRSLLGLLVWLGSEDKTNTLQIGSRLKTPTYPVWLTITNDNSGVLFSENRDLLRDYHAEYKFELAYYTSSCHQTLPIALSVNTKVPRDNDEPHSALLEKIINTKWYGANVNWNGSTPIV